MFCLSVGLSWLVFICQDHGQSQRIRGATSFLNKTAMALTPSKQSLLKLKFNWKINYSHSLKQRLKKKKQCRKGAIKIQVKT